MCIFIYTLSDTYKCYIYGILEVSILRKCFFSVHNAGDDFSCNLHIAASAYELFVKLSYIIRLLGIPRQTDDDDGRTTDDDDDDGRTTTTTTYTNFVSSIRIAL